MSAQVTVLSQLPTVTPDARQVALNIIREAQLGTYCALPGTVQAFDVNTQTADVQVNFTIVTSSTLQGGQTVPTTITYPLLASVPVLFPSGGGGAMTFPVKAGDECLLVMCDRDFSSWYVTGQTNLPPASGRFHNLSDSVAIMGFRSLKHLLQHFSATDAQLYGPDGPTGPLVSLGGGKIGLGNASGQLVTAMNALSTALDQLATALTGAVISGTSFNATTIININAAKTAWGNAKTAWDAILK